MARPSCTRLPRRPILGHGESKPFRQPIERKWVWATYQSPEEAGRGSQRSSRRAVVDAAPAAGAGGVPGEPARAGSSSRQRSFIPQCREPGEERASAQPIGGTGRWFGGGICSHSANRRRRWALELSTNRAASADRWPETVAGQQAAAMATAMAPTVVERVVLVSRADVGWGRVGAAGPGG